MTHTFRTASRDEFKTVGQLMVQAYSELDGFPKPEEQPAYYDMLSNVGDLTRNPGVEIIVAVSPEETIDGALVYIDDMKYYGSGGTATQQKNAAGFRLLAVSADARGKGLGRQLTELCIRKAADNQRTELIIHTTKAMELAWNMYERIGFQRSPDLDFTQGGLSVFGFRYSLSKTNSAQKDR